MIAIFLLRKQAYHRSDHKHRYRQSHHNPSIYLTITETIIPHHLRRVYINPGQPQQSLHQSRPKMTTSAHCTHLYVLSCFPRRASHCSSSSLRVSSGGSWGLGIDWRGRPGVAVGCREGPAAGSGAAMWITGTET